MTGDQNSSLQIRSSQQPSRTSTSRSRRAANNNYQKLAKTLYEKLAKLCLEYDAEVYFLAYRNGRFIEFVSTYTAGQPWMSPDQKALVSIFCQAVAIEVGKSKGSRSAVPAHLKRRTLLQERGKEQTKTSLSRLMLVCVAC